MQKEIVDQVQRFASLGEFAAGVANDLRALLSPIDQHALALHAEVCGNSAAHPGQVPGRAVSSGIAASISAAEACRHWLASSAGI